MKKRVLFVNDEMVIGGVSRVLINLLNQLDYDKYDVDVLILHPRGEMLSLLPKSVNVIYGTSFFNVVDITILELIKSGKLSLVLKKIKMFLLIKSGFIFNSIKRQRKKMLKKQYDVEVAFKEGFCSLFVASGDSIKKINWIHADYKVKNYSPLYNRVLIKTLNQFDHHIAVSKVAAASYQEVYQLNHVGCIHNFIQVDEIIEKAKEEVSYRDDLFTCISVGRLHPQKRYDRFIRAHAEMISQGYQFKSYIVGDGELKEELVKLIKELNVEDSFILLGQKENPFSYVKQADVFVLSSLYEGLPTVVYESLILSTPVLSLEVAGIDEQIQDGYGWVYENTQENLNEGLKYVLDHKEEVLSCKKNLESYQYDNEKIKQEIDELFQS